MCHVYVSSSNSCLLSVLADFWPKAVVLDSFSDTHKIGNCEIVPEAQETSL